MLMRFILLTQAQVATLNTYPTGSQARLEPRLIEGGDHTGKYGLPARVLVDPVHALNVPVLKMLPEITLETDDAWPSGPEE